MPINSGTASQFTTSFMRGFSFIDDINQRRLAQEKLDKRLDAEIADRKFRRDRLETNDKIRAEDRQFRLDDKAFQEQATAVLAEGVNATDDQLREFARDPRVAQELANRGIDAQGQQDAELIARSGLQAGVADPNAAPPVTGEQSNQGLSDQIQGAQIPGDELAIDAPVTKRDLNAIADLDVEEAMAIRDSQPPPPPGLGDGTALAGTVGLFDPVAPTAKEKADAKLKGKKAQINREWDEFLDIDNPVGDNLRRTEPSQLTTKYFEDRSNISSVDRRDLLDKRMRPVITQSIATQEQAHNDAENPTDLRNAERKLSEAYGLANEISLTYSPLKASGIDDKGYPVGTENQQLQDGMEQAVKEGPGFALPPDPATTQADINMINRGTTGKRINERLAIAAYRQYKNGQLNWAAYSSILQTGRLPAAAPEIVQTKPDQDTWAVYPNGRRVLLQPARDFKKDSLGGRNTLDDDALAHLNRIVSAYNTPDARQRGTQLVGTFINALSGNEQKATDAGYDLSNLLDVQSLWTRFNQIYVVRDAYDDEWFHNGEWQPDFTTNFGTIDEALFNREVDLIDRKSIANFFGDASELTSLKGRDPGFFDRVRRGAPENRGRSDAEIEAILAEQQRGN